ncbi:D-ribose pyranase [Dolosigranulum pigrum]|jgi:D-ribose pyranase|uniref:D-ribose pyranase n=1 Tax=Dolosigranulum pigrum TaxID=29394 RepID=A0A328KWU4_9LACT|nr:D-ribose pyranase [Dolosigranulum pigrum]QJS95477.1 D-ribose pyranase [Dolosigranulum pigrum]QTJ35704.1 D-ribose pyranase [Dolosigranulum pigrum]QTJ57933.1 D-ribose pyranase [Dolosigranulum pigrum]RAN60245.1 D-ribose pyranase [Dolosigranulum pigrum]RAN64397.1 D-ribose pyranase [Dolosigranulum pigrum]
MKKHGILNSSISKVLADLGHTDQIIIADCGLPIPDHVKKIDLALKLGSPSFSEVFEVVLENMYVEHAVIANEITEHNEQLENIINNSIDNINYVSHEELKKQSNVAKAIIRTGEATPYANVILQAGVNF